jgi:hypothetical protein
VHGDGHAVIHGNCLPIFANTARAIRCAYAEVSDGDIVSIDAFVANTIKINYYAAKGDYIAITSVLARTD